MQIKVIMHRDDSEKVIYTETITIKDNDNMLDEIYETVKNRNLISMMLSIGAY